MRIAFIVSRFPSLSQTFVLNQITGLVDRGHDVEIYAEGAANDSTAHIDIERYSLLEKTHYFDIPNHRIAKKLKALWLALTKFSRSPDLFLRAIRSYQDRHDIQPLGWAHIYMSAPFLCAEPYDIIYCHFGPNGLKGLAIKEINALSGKLVTAFHGYDLTKYLQSYGEGAYRKLFEDGDAFLPISHHWEQQLVELGCDQSKIQVHRMGIDTRRFPFSIRHPGKDSSVKVVTVARLTEKKGIEYGIRAIAKLVRSNPKVEYCIIGDGPLRESLQKLIEELDVENNVKLVGWKQQHEVCSMLNESHLLLAPSVTSADGDKEGIPVALMEAMSMGLPVVSTYHSGIPELVEDGETGFLIPERDADALFERLKYLIDSPDTWIKMGDKGHDRIKEVYEIDKLNDRLVEIFEQILVKEIPQEVLL